MSNIHPATANAHRAVLLALAELAQHIDATETFNEAFELRDCLTELSEQVEQLERLAMHRAEALIGVSRVRS